MGVTVHTPIVHSVVLEEEEVTPLPSSEPADWQLREVVVAGLEVLLEDEPTIVVDLLTDYAKIGHSEASAFWGSAVGLLKNSVRVFSYNPDGSLSLIAFNTGETKTFTYDLAGNLTQILLRVGTVSVLRELTYSGGALQSIEDSFVQ